MFRSARPREGPHRSAAALARTTEARVRATADRALHAASLPLTPDHPATRARLRVRVGLATRAHLQLLRTGGGDGRAADLHGHARLRGIARRARGDGTSGGPGAASQASARGCTAV